MNRFVSAILIGLLNSKVEPELSYRLSSCLSRANLAYSLKILRPIAQWFSCYDAYQPQLFYWVVLRALPNEFLRLRAGARYIRLDSFCFFKLLAGFYRGAVDTY